MIQTISKLNNSIVSERVQKNKLKGTAFEKMSCEVLKYMDRDLEKEKTIKQILEGYISKNPAYVVKKSFYLNNKRYDKHTLLTQQDYESINKIYPTSQLDILVTTIQLHKRIDFVYYDKKYDSLILFECKNKEDTYFGNPDIYKTMIYPKILNECGLNVNKVVFLYNGEFRPVTVEVIERYIRYAEIDINFIKVEDIIKKIKGLSYGGILVAKVNGKWTYENIYDSKEVRIEIDNT